MTADPNGSCRKKCPTPLFERCTSLNPMNRPSAPATTRVLRPQATCARGSFYDFLGGEVFTEVDTILDPKKLASGW